MLTLHPLRVYDISVNVIERT